MNEGEAYFDSYLEQIVYKGIRPICLRNVMLLAYKVTHDKKDGGMGDILAERVRAIPEVQNYDENKRNVCARSSSYRLQVLTIDEVMKLLYVEKRTAYEYKGVLEKILQWFVSD
jgi:hypothetical protein